MAPVLKIIKDASEFSEQEFIRLGKDLEEANFRKMLSPNDLSDGVAIELNLQKLKILEQKIKESLDRRNDYNAKFEAQTFRIVEKNPQFGESFKEGFNQGKKNSTKLLNEFYRIQFDYVYTIVDLLNFFNEIQGSYEYIDGEMLFSQQEHLDQLDNYYLRLQALDEEEDRVFQAMDDSTRSLIQEMEG